MVKKIFTLVIAGWLIYTGCAPVPQPPETEPPAGEGEVTEKPATEEPIQQEPIIQGGYFDGFPDEYQAFRLPQEIISVLDSGGRVVPLPADPTPLWAEMESIAASFGYDLSSFDQGRVVEFTSENGYSYISVPANESFAKESGCTGLIFDKNGAYNGTFNIYEVRFYDDKAVFRDPNGNEVSLYKETGEFFTSPELSPSEIPLVVFIHNGCWLCGCILGKCGCVYCR